MIQQAVIIASIVLFIHSCTWDGMIFGKVKNFIKPEGMFYKPVYGCPICMTPWWGTLIYWLFFHISLQDWILTVGTASGLSVVSICLLALRDAALKVEEKFGSE